jgi:hypothetical protein
VFPWVVREAHCAGHGASRIFDTRTMDISISRNDKLCSQVSSRIAQVAAFEDTQRKDRLGMELSRIVGSGDRSMCIYRARKCAVVEGGCPY